MRCRWDTVQPSSAFHALADLGGCLECAGAGQAQRAGEIEPGFVEPERLHEVGILVVKCAVRAANTSGTARSAALPPRARGTLRAPPTAPRRSSRQPPSPRRSSPARCRAEAPRARRRPGGVRAAPADRPARRSRRTRSCPNGRPRDAPPAGRRLSVIGFAPPLIRASTAGSRFTSLQERMFAQCHRMRKRTDHGVSATRKGCWPGYI